MAEGAVPMSGQRHISVPKAFAGGDVCEWLTRFEICARANAWDDTRKALTLPTLLEGEALAVWLELSEAEQADYKVIKEKLIAKLRPAGFVLLDEFHARKLRPDESPSLFRHELKKLLERAMPGVDTATRDRLLIHQFLLGLPIGISRQLRATGETTKLDAVVNRARLLMTLEEQEHNHTVAISNEPRQNEVQELREEVAKLTEQVIALTTADSRRTQRCFSCNRQGHTQRECPDRRRQARRNLQCWQCGQLGHFARDCRQQGNDRGASARVNSCPSSQQ